MMKPMNKRASKCAMELWENKHWITGNKRRLIVRRFWKRQASKAGRKDFDPAIAEAEHWDEYYAY